MENNVNDDLIGLLSSDIEEIRTHALNWLCEGYARESSVISAVFAGWDRWGVENAFPEFPQLSYLPISADVIEECCRKAKEMASGRKLVNFETRSAGKLIENVGRMRPSDLQPHMELLKKTVASSRIFFRVDVPGIENRISMMGLAADDLAGKLNESIASLMEDLDDATAGHRGLHALEALRREHPEYLDLAAIFAKTPASEGPEAISFQLTLQSLAQFSEEGLESHLAKHLHDQRESVFVPIVEVLVRTGTQQAADVLFQQFESANLANRQWIARGLQRIRVKGLADRIAALRAETEDPHVWLMLLVAEIRQMDPGSYMRIAADVSRVRGHSYALVNSLMVYSQLVNQEEPQSVIGPAFTHYLTRVGEELQRKQAEKMKKLKATDRRTRERQRAQALKRFRNR